MAFLKPSRPGPGRGGPTSPVPAGPAGPGAPADPGAPAGPGVPAAAAVAGAEPAESEPAGRREAAAAAGASAEGVAAGLPLLPGFREMALRRMAGERRRMVAELAARRQAAGLSQTQVAACMGTSQSAVARIEAGHGDVRVTTLERYAAAVGRELSWRLSGDRFPGGS